MVLNHSQKTKPKTPSNGKFKRARRKPYLKVKPKPYLMAGMKRDQTRVRKSQEYWKWFADTLKKYLSLSAYELFMAHMGENPEILDPKRDYKNEMEEISFFIKLMTGRCQVPGTRCQETGFRNREKGLPLRRSREGGNL